MTEATADYSAKNPAPIRSFKSFKQMVKSKDYKDKRVICVVGGDYLTISKQIDEMKQLFPQIEYTSIEKAMLIEEQKDLIIITL